MKDVETGIVLTEKDLINHALEHLADACCFLYECQSDEGKALGWMVDAAMKYGQVIYRSDDVLVAATDYSAYEEMVGERHEGSSRQCEEE